MRLAVWKSSIRSPLLRSSNIPPRLFSTKKKGADLWTIDRVNSYVGHSFSDFLEHWNRKVYRKVGYGLAASTALCTGTTAIVYDTLLSSNSIPAAMLAATTAVYFKIGESDINQSQYSVRRNYPVIGNLRYAMGTIRPFLQDYIVESDRDGRPFDRMQRNQIYQRSKNADDTMPLGTRRNLYDINTEWACHSMWPKSVPLESARHTIGTADYGTSKMYSSSMFNISALSYGTISDNAILSLNHGAKLGKFSNNTGEGGVSRSHMRHGGDLVWNIGTGYYGCGTGTTQRMFDETYFRDSLDEANGQVKMIEIKLSQGAVPAHAGVFPTSSITKEIAHAGRLPFPPEGDIHSPSSHSAFRNAPELIEFISRLREASGGLPVGIKMCVGQASDVAALCKAILAVGNGPDFITVDGAEGGTGGAPPEFSDSVGLPLEEGLVLVRDMLVGAGLKEKTSIIASGRITSGFAIVRNLALGADVTNSARGFMMSLGCIQALKCNTGKCPTGIATTNKELMHGLVPEDKAIRVYNYHNNTMKIALDIIGAIGHQSISDVCGNDIMRRVTTKEVRTLSEHFPEVLPGCLLEDGHPNSPIRLKEVWDVSRS